MIPLPESKTKSVAELRSYGGTETSCNEADAQYRLDLFQKLDTHIKRQRALGRSVSVAEMPNQLQNAVWAAKGDGWLRETITIKHPDGTWRRPGYGPVFPAKAPGNVWPELTPGKATDDQRRIVARNMAVGKIDINGIPLIIQGIRRHYDGKTCPPGSKNNLEYSTQWLKRGHEEGWLRVKIEVMPSHGKYFIPIRQKKRTLEQRDEQLKKRRKAIEEELVRIKAVQETAAKELELIQVAEDLAKLNETIKEKKRSIDI